MEVPDPRRQAPAASRNRDAILSVLRDILPARGVVLELASGSGEHVVHFAAALPELTFQPSDPDAAALASIDAWAASRNLANIRPALALDARASEWPVGQADAVLCINMIHIAPWQAALGLLRGAAGLLTPGAPLILYGPFRRDGLHTAASNAAFDADLRGRDSSWGVRDLGEVAAAAAAIGFGPPIIRDMPANNLIVLFRRQDRAIDAPP